MISLSSSCQSLFFFLETHHVHTSAHLDSRTESTCIHTMTVTIDAQWCLAHFGSPKDNLFFKLFYSLTITTTSFQQNSLLLPFLTMVQKKLESNQVQVLDWTNCKRDAEPVSRAVPTTSGDRLSRSVLEWVMSHWILRFPSYRFESSEETHHCLHVMTEVRVTQLRAMDRPKRFLTSPAKCDIITKNLAGVCLFTVCLYASHITTNFHVALLCLGECCSQSQNHAFPLWILARLQYNKTPKCGNAPPPEEHNSNTVATPSNIIIV